jgi:heme-degrading monooxygenase HmoA
MAFWSLLMFKAHAGQTDRSAQAFIKRRAIEESAETIPGFLHGELVVSTDEPDLLCVLCSWTDEAAYRQWLASPLRAKQGPDLQGLADGESKTMMFRSVHTVSKPPASGTSPAAKG